MTLKNIPTESLTAIQVSQLKTVREAIPLPTRETPLQKVIPQEYIDGYLNGFDKMGGFIAREADLRHAKTASEVIEALRLDYNNSLFDSNKSYGIIRYHSSTPNNIEIPYGEVFMKGSPHTDPPPFTGNGMTSSRDGAVIPELRSPNDAKLRDFLNDGAELIEVTNGIEKVKGFFDKEQGIFIAK